MKRYLCLGYYDPAAFDRMSEADQEGVGERCRPHDEGLRATGRLRSVASLEHGIAVTLRPGAAAGSRGGRPSVMDGPFTEAKEIVGSFWIIEAEDLEDAVRVASLHPAANIGAEMGWGVEVRPIEFYDDDHTG